MQIESYIGDMHEIVRSLQNKVLERLVWNPVVALLGPRQCGKTTLAKQVAATFPSSLYVDLENPADLRRLDDPQLFLDANRESLIILDEIQLKPELFSFLRSWIDRHERQCHLLLLGSASPHLLRQSSQSLAGRLSYLELTPFLVSELSDFTLQRFWERGGFPLSLLPESLAQSSQWRADYLRALVERDLPQLGLALPPAKLWRLLGLLAHSHGELLNSSKLGEVMGASHTTFRSWLDWLEGAFLVRTLPPWVGNDKKRLIKSPKVYWRDVGLWLNVLGVSDFNSLLGHPKLGDAWEGLVIDQILGALDQDWRASFYRTSHGVELDLVLERGSRRIGIECKATTAPSVTRGFWTARDDLGLSDLWVVCPLDTSYPWKDGVTVGGLRPCIDWLLGMV